MDQTTSLVVDAGSFQTSYADDVVTASNGPACTSASANPACAAATSAWAFATSGRSEAPATACARRTEKYACAAASAALWRAWTSEASADDTAASACLIWYRAWRLSSSSDADTVALLLVVPGPPGEVVEAFPYDVPADRAK